ncbi:MAG: hypothetical protein JWP44_1847 [Mucilaginibacter sp.]|nr:hypothetical protein [Mucilaginibacter sp.]
MKKIYLIPVLCLLLLSAITFRAQAQASPKPMQMPGTGYPWSDRELLEPSVLAAQIKGGAGTTPLIFNIGSVKDIKGAKHIGPVGKAENLEKFTRALSALPKNTELVIYCGCCPFTKCPNNRPAFLELEKSGFTNVKVLNLPVNLKTNWIANGFPLAK